MKMEYSMMMIIHTNKLREMERIGLASETNPTICDDDVGHPMKTSLSFNSISTHFTFTVLQHTERVLMMMRVHGVET